MAVIVSFLDEAEYLPTLLASIAAQTEPPEQLLLVDDGSADASYDIAEAFARDRAWVRTVRRPRRAPSKDRLVEAAELLAFQAGVERLEEPWDIVAKLDADLRLNSELFRAVRQRLADIPELGVTGSYLSVLGRNMLLRREQNPRYHVRGPNKFYRRRCFEQISPLPPILGWDTIDDLRARLHGWKTESFAPDSGDSIHLRPVGTHDGILRAYRRWGRCHWGYGSHPLWVLLGGMYYMRDRPYVFGGLAYIWGWVDAAVHGYPRAEPAVRTQARHEELAELRRHLFAVATGRRIGAHRARARAGA